MQRIYSATGGNGQTRPPGGDQDQDPPAEPDAGKTDTIGTFAPAKPK